VPHRDEELETLRAWAEGELPPEEAFARLYAAYARPVRAWLIVRAGAAADDLFQDVWTIFLRRCREWRHPPAADRDPDARPVLGFLFRTCELVLLAHRRIQARRETSPLADAAHPTVDGQAHALRAIQLGECLDVARRHCSDTDCAVLMAKLAGVPAGEIARTLGLTHAAVDHRFRNTVARVREALSPGGEGAHA
jgi:DNA-directed RNA polymerase specialized sigma24 family protein